MSSFGSHLKSSEGSFKPRISSFCGEKDLDAYLEWEKEMELVFNCHHYTEEKKVRKAASTFRGHANIWWEQTATTRRFLGEPQISSWFEMKSVMKKRFVSTFNGIDLHPKLRRVYQNSRSVDDYYQKVETIPVRATQLEQPTRRRHPIQGPLETPSKPHIIKAENYGVKPKEKDKDDAKVLLVKDTTTNQQLDLRTNPVKGGEDGVILTSPDFKDMEDPILQNPIGRKGDIRPIDQAYQPNQEELSHDSTCSRNYIHQGITEKKNRLKSSSH